MEISIRAMTKSDVPQVLAMMQDFAAFENLSEFCTVTGDRLVNALFAEVKVAEGLCAFAGETAVGYAIYYPNFSTFRGQMGLYLEDIYITKEHRGRGLGEMMIKELARIAASRGFERIDFMVLDWNTPAVNFYQKLGAVRDPDERHFKFIDDAFRSLI